MPEGDSIKKLPVLKQNDKQKIRTTKHHKSLIQRKKFKIAGGRETRIENGESIPVRQAVIGWCKNQKNVNEIKTIFNAAGSRAWSQEFSHTLPEVSIIIQTFMCCENLTNFLKDLLLHQVYYLNRFAFWNSEDSSPFSQKPATVLNFEPVH